MNKVVVLLFVVLMALMGNVAMACWHTPPDVEWGKSENGKFEFKRENKLGIITVYHAYDKKSPLWQVKLEEFDGLFSDIYLTDNGEILVHVRGNHLVNELGDTAVCVMQSKGPFIRFPAKDFIDKLIKSTTNISTAPNFMWMKSVEQVSTDFITVVNAKRERKVVSFKGLTTKKNSELKPSNFPYMLRGYCYAGSLIKDEKALGGFGGSKNYPKQLYSKEKEEAVYLLVQPDMEVPFANELLGMKLFLVNGSGEKQAFTASDSRLYILQEAKDQNGNWKPIEYFPSSWCGNSRHKVFLGTKQYWEFSVPKYTGSISTTLRFSLSMGEDKTIYSNEFKGSINPEQFTTKQGHEAKSWMDPYVY